MRTIAAVALLFLIGVSAVEAAETQGTVKSVDTTKNTITVTVTGKDQTFPVSKDASFVTVSQVAAKKKKGKTMEKLTPIDNGLAGVSAGASVTLLTDTVDTKEVVTSLKVTNGKAPAAAGKKKKKKK
jgi:hypothetical protein